MENQNNEIMETINKHVDQLKNIEFNAIMDYINRYEAKKEKEFEQKQKEIVPSIPNDKVVLSANVFSKLVNFVAVKENEDDSYKGFLNEMLEDVKKNRSSFEKKPVEPSISMNTSINTNKVNTGSDKARSRLGSWEYPKNHRQKFHNLFREAFNEKDMDEMSNYINAMLNVMNEK
jgi:hypothetical protein